MIIMLDTNVILDCILHRADYDNASKILNLAIQNQEIECVTSISITTINYISLKERKDGRKMFTPYEVQDLLHRLLDYLIIIESTEKEFNEAYKLNWKDFEDAIQYTTALANGVDYIITNNVKDFETPLIPVMTPKEFLDMYENK